VSYCLYCRRVYEAHSMLTSLAALHIALHRCNFLQLAPERRIYNSRSNPGSQRRVLRPRCALQPVCSHSNRVLLELSLEQTYTYMCTSVTVSLRLEFAFCCHPAVQFLRRNSHFLSGCQCVLALS
jgi:hypothetical protein